MKIKNRIIAVFMSLIISLSVFSVYIQATGDPASIPGLEAGDINSDGEVDNLDVISLFQYVSGWGNTVNSYALDVNADEEVDNLDVIALFQFVSGWDITLHIKIPCNHDGGTEIRGAKEPVSCAEEGYTGDVYCLICGNVISYGSVIPPLPHTGAKELRNHLDPTCTQDGYTGDIYCLDCGNVITYGETIPAVGSHGETKFLNKKDATCTQDGYTGDAYCSVCNELLYEGTVIPATGVHTGGVATYYSRAICTSCGQEYGEFADILAYDQLNENQKLIYNAIDSAVARFERNWFDVPFVEGTTVQKIKSDVRVALNAVAYDKPEYFWMPKTYAYEESTDSLTGWLLSFKMSFVFSYEGVGSSDYNITLEEKSAMQAELDVEIRKILSVARTFETDFEKELYIHDYLCDNITYDNASADAVNSGGTADFRTYTIYGALINHTCVCEGYSRAMQYLCRQLGIPCGLVSGLGQGGPHMWNIINPGDGLYYIDVTFDDSIENNGLGLPGLHNYFNLNKEQLQTDHSLDGLYAEGVDYSKPSTDFNFFELKEENTEYYYYTKSGAYIYKNDASSAAQFALNAFKDGHSAIEVQFDAEISSDEAVSLLANSLVGKLRVVGKDNPFGNYLIVVLVK